MPNYVTCKLVHHINQLHAILDVNNTLKPLDECATSIKVKQQLWTHLFNNERTRLKFKVAKILCQIFQYGCKDNSTTIPDVKWKTLRNEIELENIYQSKFYWRGRRADVLVINAGIEKKTQKSECKSLNPCYLRVMFSHNNYHIMF